MQLQIICPERILFSGEVESVKVPGVAGEFEILNNHAAIVSVLERGRVEYAVAGDGRHQVEISGGFVEVCRGDVKVCVEVCVC